MPPPATATARENGGKTINRGREGRREDRRNWRSGRRYRSGNGGGGSRAVEPPASALCPSLPPSAAVSGRWSSSPSHKLKRGRSCPSLRNGEDEGVIYIEWILWGEIVINWNVRAKNTIKRKIWAWFSFHFISFVLSTYLDYFTCPMSCVIGGSYFSCKKTKIN